MTFHPRYLAHAAVLATAGALVPVDAAHALKGCVQHSVAYYQIGQDRRITAWDAMPRDQPIIESEASGVGTALANCTGTVRFVGSWSGRSDNMRVPLKVGGLEAGMGIEVYVRPKRTGQEHGMPHEYTLEFREGEAITTSDTYVGYRIFRTSGPIVYGVVDTGQIALQHAIDSEGKKTPDFRLIHVHQLTLVRPTCTIAPEDLNQRVDLGSYNLSNFGTPERATPWVAYRMHVSSCEAAPGLIAAFTFGDPGDADSLHPDWFSLRGPENVALELATADRVTTPPGKKIPLPAGATGDAYEFNVRLRETQSTVRGGSFNRPIRVQVEYR